MSFRTPSQEDSAEKPLPISVMIVGSAAISTSNRRPSADMVSLAAGMTLSKKSLISFLPCLELTHSFHLLTVLVSESRSLPDWPLVTSKKDSSSWPSAPSSLNHLPSAVVPSSKIRAMRLPPVDPFVVERSQFANVLSIAPDARSSGLVAASATFDRNPSRWPSADDSERVSFSDRSNIRPMNFSARGLWSPASSRPAARACVLASEPIRLRKVSRNRAAPRTASPMTGAHVRVTSVLMLT
jgi:hypothetical protein